MAKETIKVETISSMEVAKMIEKDHKNLMRDIAKYTKYLEESNKDLGQLNFEPSSLDGKSNELKIEPVENCIINLNEFWMNSTYLDGKGERRPCFSITKKGCEFIAHKCTGQKGVVFTARYINKFHELEEKANKNRLIHVSDKPAPRAITFYKRNLSRIELFAKIGEFTKREAIDELISYASTRFDMEEATIQYIVDVGEKPRYRLDIFDYFPEIGEFGEEYLKFMIDFNLSSYAERRKKKNGSKEAKSKSQRYEKHD
nr:MAG TPA: regulatory protein [Bacteriophage sp.]